jgi:hypothetical protein
MGIEIVCLQCLETEKQNRPEEVCCVCWKRYDDDWNDRNDWWLSISDPTRVPHLKVGIDLEGLTPLGRAMQQRRRLVAVQNARNHALAISTCQNNGVEQREAQNASVEVLRIVLGNFGCNNKSLILEQQYSVCYLW